MARTPGNQSDPPPLRLPTDEEFEVARQQSAAGNYERRKAQGGPEWALWSLHRRLVTFAQLYETCDLQDQRDAVASSVLAIHDYLIGRGFAPASLGPLLRVVAALGERENGSLDLLFCERAKSGRPKSTLADQNRAGVLAALASLWLELHPDDDRKQMQKLSDAARSMKGRWFGKIEAANLKTARDLAMQEAKDHPTVMEATRFRSDVIEPARQKFGDASIWAVLVRFLNDMSSMYDGALKIEKTRSISPSEDD